MQREFYSLELSESGKAVYFDTTDFISPGSLVYDKFKYINYRSTDSVVPFFDRGVMEKLVQPVKIQSLINQQVAKDAVRFDIYFSA